MKNSKVFSRLVAFVTRSQFIYYSHQLFAAAALPLLVLAGLRLGSYYFSPPVPVVLGSFGMVLIWLVYRVTAATMKLPKNKIKLANRLVDRDESWEVVRVGLDASESLQPYYQKRLKSELKDFLSAKTPAAVLNEPDRRKLFVFVLLVVLVLPVGLLPPVSVVTSKSSYRSWRLAVKPRVVLPGDTAVVSLRGQYSGRPPRLLVGDPDSEATRTVEWSSRGDRLTWTSFRLKNSMDLYLKKGRRRKKMASLRVVSPPRLESVTTQIYPPDYTRLPVREVRGDVLEAFPGSSVRVRVRASRTLANLRISRRGGQEIAVVHGTESLDHSQYVLNPGVYRITGADSHGFRTNVHSYRVSLKEDPPPELSLVEPARGETVPGQGLLTVRVEYSDRFGLSSARLTAESAGGQEWERSLPVPERQPEGELYGHIKLDELDLSPGEKFQFTVSARDLDDVRGPKRSVLGPVELRAYTWKEVMADKEQSRVRGSSGLEEAAGEVAELRDKLEDLISSGQPDDWETSRQLQQLEEKLEEKARDLKRAQKQLKNYRKGPPGLSRQSLERLSEIQSMVEEHGLKSLRQSQEALREQVQKDSFSRDKLDYSREQLEQFEQDIQRTHEYLKNIEPALEVDRMGQTLKQMAEKQKGLDEADESERRRLLENQAEKWEWMQERLNQVAEQSADATGERLKQLRKTMEQSDLAEQARSLADSPSENKLNEYRRRTANMKRRMQGMTTSQFARQQEQQGSLQAKLVDYWTHWHLFLQRWSREAKQLKVPPRFLAQYGAELEDLHSALDKFSRLRQGWEHLARTTREIAGLDLNFPREIVNRLDDQAERLEKIYGWLRERNLRRVKRKLPGLVESQARLIHEFLNWSRQKPPGGRGGPSSLQQSLSAQKQLQQQLAPLFQQQSVSPRMARRLARQQRMIRQSLEQISRRAQHQREIMGDLKELVDSMKQAEGKMEKREFDAQLKQKQEQIMRRLEQATKNLENETADQQRVKSERKATSGLDVEAEPETTDFQQIMNSISGDLEGLSSAERESVIRFYRFFYQQDGGDTSGEDE